MNYLKNPVLRCVVLCVCFVILSCAENQMTHDTDLPTEGNREILEFQAFSGNDVMLVSESSCEHLIKNMRLDAVARLKNYWQSMSQNECATKDILYEGSSFDGQVADLNYSEQNSQISDVLEADSVFTNGDYIFVLNHSYSSGAIKIYKSWPLSDIAQVAEIKAKDLPGNNEFNSIYKFILKDNKLVVFANLYFGSDYQNYSGQIVFDVSNPEEPQSISADLLKDGYWHDARLMDSNLVSAYSISFAMPVNGNFEGEYADDVLYQISENCESGYEYSDTYKVLLEKQIASEIDRVNSATIEDLLPQITSIDFQSNTSQTQSLSCENIFNNQYTIGQGLTVIMSEDMQNELPQATSFGVVGSTSQMFMNQESLVLTSILSPQIYKIVDEKGAEMMASVLYRFVLDDGLLNYKSSGVVAGSIPNSFAIDSVDDILRVVTEIKESSFSIPNDVNVTILKENGDKLEKIAKITDIASGESVFATRYVDDRLYLVTYQVEMNHDPLFVIDLADPKNPTVLGQLNMEGFSSYLAKIDDHTLLGIGQSDTTCWWNASCIGSDYKISLYDVSDEYVPLERSQVILPAAESYANIDHLAVHYDSDSGKLFLPIMTYDETLQDYLYQIAVFDLSQSAIMQTATIEVDAEHVGSFLRTVSIGQESDGPVLYIIGDSGVQTVAEGF